MFVCVCVCKVQISFPFLSCSYAEFIRQTEDMNSLDCYGQLISRAQHIGYRISKVVYRGYEATKALQATHDDAVRTRMKLKLDAESEEQEQTIMKFKLQREKERTKLSESFREKGRRGKEGFVFFRA